MKRDRLLNASVFTALGLLFLLVATGGRLPWFHAAHGADWCEIHQVPLSKDEKCNLKLKRGGTFTQREREPKEGECPNTLVRVTLGPGVAERAGLELVAVEAHPISETIRANAETDFPPTRRARIAPRMPGAVREVRATLGQAVEAGAPLAVLDSAEFGEAKAAYLQALLNLTRCEKTCAQEEALAARDATNPRDLLAAQTARNEVRLTAKQGAEKLAGLGLSEAQVAEIVARQDTSPLLVMTAPFAGTVIEASAVLGELAAPDRPLFTVADPERMWLAIDVQEADLPRIERDQKAWFTLESFPGMRFPGKVVAVGGEVDDRTRTVRVTAEVKNLKGVLRAKMFGRADILIRPAEPKMLVPKSALQNDGDCNLVFVTTSPNVFQARKVEIGVVYDAGYEVTSGLTPGERVVGTGAFLLRTEVLRGQMGAG